MLHKKILFTLIAFTCAISNAYAGDAVSGVNTKVSAFAGSVDGAHTENTAVAISFPVSKNLGIQIDGQVGQLGNSDSNGIGAHVFWRDSDIGLAGVTYCIYL